MPVFERIAIVGLGLLGGSVGLAAKASGAARIVVGATRQADAQRRALESGAVDEVVDLAEVGRGADLVVLATPVYAMHAVLERLAPSLSAGAIVTDVGSVKAPVVPLLSGALPTGVSYVGSHPMAGSHERGMSSAQADLFRGAACVVLGDAQDAAAARVADFWRALGARVVRRGAEEHDVEVAWTSHLPHLLAFAFAHALDAMPKSASEVSGAGFRDFTRIAYSDPELWADILSANRKAVAAPLAALGASLGELSRAVEAGDAETLEALLTTARNHLFRASPAEESHAGTPSEPESSPSKRGATQRTRRTKYVS